jgi:Glyoxalase At5g48480-like, N-terminal domain
MSVNPIPAGFHTIAPNIIVKSVDEAVSFYKQAFGAEEVLRLSMPDGKVVHCELKFGDSRVNLGESMEGWPEHALLAQIFCRRFGCGFRAGCEGRCRSVESHDRYVFWLTGRARPRSIRQHMDDFDAHGKRLGRRNAAASQCTRCLT